MREATKAVIPKALTPGAARTPMQPSRRRRGAGEAPAAPGDPAIDLEWLLGQLNPAFAGFDDPRLVVDQSGPMLSDRVEDHQAFGRGPGPIPPVAQPTFVQSFDADAAQVFRTTSANNWAGVLAMACAYEALRLEGGVTAANRTAVLDHIYACYDQSFKTRGRGAVFNRFSTELVTKFPMLEPYRDDFNRTFGLCTVQAKNIAGAPDDARRDAPRDTVEELAKKITAKWHCPSISCVFLSLCTQLPLGEWNLTRFLVRPALEWIVGRIVPYPPEEDARRMAVFRVVRQLQVVMPWNAATFDQLQILDWDLAVAALNLRTTGMQLSSVILEAISRVPGAPLPPAYRTGHFVRDVAREAFGRVPVGKKQVSKAVLHAWRHCSDPRDIATALRALPAEAHPYLIDSVILLACDPVQYVRVLDGVFDEILPLDDVIARVFRFADDPQRVGVPPTYDWWPLVCFDTLEQKILHGWEWLKQMAPWFMWDLAKCELNFFELAVLLTVVTDEQLRNWVTSAIEASAAYRVRADLEQVPDPLAWMD